MGTGKTSVGRILAEKCGLAFVDIDECISKKAGMDIPSIFAKHGESYFRELEKELLKEIVLNEYQLISCGGGIVTKESNRKVLKENAVICWLYNTVETSLLRINETSRPLLNTSTPIEKAIGLLRVREAFYSEVAHFGICTENLDQRQIAAIIYENIYKPVFTRK